MCFVWFVVFVFSNFECLIEIKKGIYFSVSFDLILIIFNSNVGVFIFFSFVFNSQYSYLLL